MKNVLTIDLDNTVFNTTPIFKEAFKRYNKKFYYSTDFDIKKCYPNDVANEIVRLFSDELWYSTTLFNKEIPTILNKLNDFYDIYYVSSRIGENPKIDSYNQLLKNGIKCTLDQIIKASDNKVKILKNLHTDLHFDDGPHVIEGCLNFNIDCHMISSKEMRYNHYLRNKVKYSKNLKEAIIKEKLIENIKQ